MTNTGIRTRRFFLVILVYFSSVSRNALFLSEAAIRDADPIPSPNWFALNPVSWSRIFEIESRARIFETESRIPVPYPEFKKNDPKSQSQILKSGILVPRFPKLGRGF